MTDFTREKYIGELENIRFSPDFEDKTIELVNSLGKPYKTGGKMKAILAAAAVLILSCVTAFAMPGFLTARQVAERLNMTELGALLESDRSVKAEKSIDAGEYLITLHSAVSADELVNIEGADTLSEREYFVISLMKKDGSALDNTKDIIRFTPLVDGFNMNDVNVCTLGTSMHIIEENGILYYLAATDSLKPYRGKKIYMAAFDGMMPFGKIITKENGEFDYAENYEGIRAIFELPEIF